RAQHAGAEGPADPHAVAKGAWFAHVGWLFHRREASAEVTRLADLWTVRSIRLQHRYYAALAVGVGLGPAGGRRRRLGRPVGRASRGRVPSSRADAPSNVLRELTRPSDRSATL